MDITKERNDQFTCLCTAPATILGHDALTYVGLSCIEVKKVLPAIITVEAVLNFVGLFISAWFAGLVTFSPNNGRFREWRKNKAKSKRTPSVAAKGVSADTEAARPMMQDGAALLQT